MKNQNIQIINLGPMRITSISAFGTSPEKEAWKKLIAHPNLNNFIKNKNEHPVFGFSSGQPSPENPEFAYEFWVKIGAEFESPLLIIDFSGGSYAVTRCLTQTINSWERRQGWENITDWCKNNNIKPGYHQALEKFVRVNDKFENLILDLYFPIIY